VEVFIRDRSGDTRRELGETFEAALDGLIAGILLDGQVQP
jgi:hypothetical protein